MSTFDVRFDVRGDVVRVSEHIATMIGEELRRVPIERHRERVALADSIERVLVGESTDPIPVALDEAWPLHRLLDVMLITPPRDVEALALHEAVRSWLEDEGQVSGGRMPRE